MNERAASTGASRSHRLPALDVVRGLVMVVMALDHVRDFVGPSPLLPEDMDDPGLSLFLTRWITHFCAPAFVLLAGIGTYLYQTKTSAAAVRKFLWTRGLWLVFLEIVVVKTCWSFSLPVVNLIVLQVIWVIGLSMIILAAMTFLPRTVIAMFGLLLIVAHNGLDSWGFEQHVGETAVTDFGAPEIVWGLLHVGKVGFVCAGTFIAITYPLVPWLGVMVLGYALGPLFRMDASRRRWTLFLLGGLSVGIFVWLRIIGGYGDPKPFDSSGNGAAAMISLLNTEKYPPSLHYLLMTLGPIFVALALFDRYRPRWSQVLMVYGRVPLFFYLLHFAVGNLVGGLYFYFFHGLSRFQDALVVGPPEGFVLDLTAVYVAWVIVLVVTYPLCRWYAGFKRRHANWWLLSYL